MAQHPEDKTMDFSGLPRGAIGIKGLPVSRNTRLPSIRSPRDLTLGAPPKRMFMPNIPVRREKKPPVSETVSQPKQESDKFDNKKINPHQSDRGRGRGRGKSQIIQTQGSIFGEGIAQDPLTRKERLREAYHKSDYSVSRGVSIKKEKDDDVAGVSKKMDQLFKDDFIDDGDDDDDEMLMKPTIFPATAEIKRETKKEPVVNSEPAANFDPNIAKEMGFDVNRVAKFIKKEKGSEVEEKPKPAASEMTSNTKASLVDKVPSKDIRNILSGDTNSSKLVLLKFPEFIAMNQKMDDSETPSKRSANSDSKVPDNQNTSFGSVKQLPEGYLGKLQVMKSGKARLLVGSVEFSLDSVDNVKSKHEVVSIRTDSNSGDLSVLGYLQHQLKFVPNEDCLLE